MRAVRLKQFGFDGLGVEELAEPVPGAGEVLLRVRAVSLNYRDVLIVRGEYDPRLKLPLVPCSDAACEVVAVGDGVTEVGVGERVTPIFSRGWHEGPPTRETPRRALGGPCDGTLAELIVASAGDVARLPAYLDDVRAATLYCAGLTAYRALFELATTNETTRVLVLGTGGVSTFAVSLARAAGADVTVVSRDAEKLERAVALGADTRVLLDGRAELGRRRAGSDAGRRRSGDRRGGRKHARGVAPRGAPGRHDFADRDERRRAGARRTSSRVCSPP